MKKAERLNQELIFLGNKEGFQLKDLMEEFCQWEYEGNVDMINAGLMQTINNVATELTTQAPGYTEAKEDTFNMMHAKVSFIGGLRGAKA